MVQLVLSFDRQVPFWHIFPGIVDVHQIVSSRGGRVSRDLSADNIAQRAFDPLFLFDEVGEQLFSGKVGGDLVNAWFRRLVRLDNSDWWSAALWAMRYHRGDPEFLDGFFRRLERLAASMLIRRVYTTPRVERYTRLLTELDDRGLDASAFDLDASEIVGTAELLGGDLYLATRVRMYVLLRLDELLAAADGPLFPHKRITIEHVLPQNPEQGSEWCSTFTGGSACGVDSSARQPGPAQQDEEPSSGPTRFRHEEREVLQWPVWRYHIRSHRPGSQHPPLDTRHPQESPDRPSEQAHRRMET